MTKFRVHYADGTSVVIAAEHPDEARSTAARRRPSLQITKIKRAKGGSDV